MERLDSCYFCGTATDTPLREVSIAPRARRGDPEATVRATLCPACEGKLERVLDGLFDHVESRRVDDEPADATEEPAPAEDEPTSSADPVDRIDVTADERSGRAGRRRLSSGPSDGDGSEAASDGPDPADTAEEDAEVLDDEPRVRARATTSPEDPLEDVSVDEYNRVMRLLQNREFPMGRGAFVDLASNAYDLGEDTVERVLDAVIDDGALAERDGQLVRPGGDTA